MLKDCLDAVGQDAARQGNRRLCEKNREGEEPRFGIKNHGPKTVPKKGRALSDF